ncbi:cation-translocating P-type ATPase [bacterium]|nr:cation-translocating P-type ATPase [bacterium]
MPPTDTTVDVHALAGLGDADVARRIARDGFNELPSLQRTSLLAIVINVVREPMFILLVTCGVLYLVLGEMEEALMLLGFVFVVMGITFYQERKTERALEALRDLSSPRALVVRNGAKARIPGREVVRDDIILIAEGDRVPADAELVYTVNLSVDESLLTGESVPVRKRASKGEGMAPAPGGDGTPFVFSGTLVTQGQGIARVFATGLGTEMGRIGKRLATLEIEDTLLQRETARIVRVMSAAGLLLCAIVAVGYGAMINDWIKGFLAGLTLAMALLPEEFPVVLTVFLALGAWRMSRRNVLTRRVPAVETLGSATVLCVDKTGTLTQNAMAVNTLVADGGQHRVGAAADEPLPEGLHELVEYAILASKRNPFDPMEKALKRLGEYKLSDTEHLHGDWELIHEYPLSEDLLAMSRVWQSPNGRDYVIAAKGAPEAIADLCHLDGQRKRAMDEQVARLADDGLRVLGVAHAAFSTTDLPDGQHDFDFEYLGLIGLADPVRPAVPAAVAECRQAGVRVVMITGDYPGTALNIARQIGLATDGTVITGDELAGMTDRELRERVRAVTIFARVVPEQKLRIVTAFKANGDIVAMTGDGVNDAPALKAAHIGIAMGGRGTDVAREAASLVLVDDDFSSIVAAIRMGRRIFDNLKKAMSYIVAIHVPIAGISLLPLLLGLPPVLAPVHIVFLELIIDPACSIVYEVEPEEAGVMHRPPRKLGEPLMGRRTLMLSVLQGLIVLVITAIVHVITMRLGRGEAEARALVFTTLVVANLGLIVTNRSWSRTALAMLRTPNAALYPVVFGAVAVLAAVLYVPFLQDLFAFNTLHLPDAVICLVSGIVSVLWFEILKLVHGRKHAAPA